MPGFTLHLRRSSGSTQYDYDGLTFEADTIEELDALVSSATLSSNPLVTPFFGRPAEAQAVQNVTKAFPGSQVETAPAGVTCQTCGGSTTAKQITIKNGANAGQKRTVFNCNQDRGPCMSGNFPTTTWGASKGRDS